jgi:hypothetical protein
MITEGGVLLWDGVAGRGGRWLDTETDDWVEKRDTTWEVAAAEILHRHAGNDPWTPFLAEKENPAEPPIERAAVFTTQSGDPIEVAERIAARHRTARRPVVVVPSPDAGTPLAGLRLMLADDPHASDDDAVGFLEEWKGDRPFVIFAGADVEPATALVLEEALAPAVSLGIVTRHHVLARWPPEVRRRFAHVVEDSQSDDLPEPVRAQLAAGHPPVLAWAYGAMAHFDVGDRPSAERLLRLRTGLSDPLADEVVRGWWEEGDLAVEADGRVKLAHDGWAALADALAGDASNEATDPVRAGLWLAEYLSERSR